MEAFARRSDLYFSLSGCTGSQETVLEAAVVSKGEATGTQQGWGLWGHRESQRELGNKHDRTW